VTRRATAIATTLLLMAVPALARAPVGAKYLGRTSQGNRILLRVVAGGGLHLDFHELLRCSRGPDKDTHAIFHAERPQLRADGSFDYRKTYRHLPPVHGFTERQTERQHLIGAVSAAKAFGTIDDLVIGERTGLRCHAHLTFKATRRR